MSIERLVGARLLQDAFPQVTVRFDAGYTTVPYVLVGGQWCPSCCTSVVQPPSANNLGLAAHHLDDELGNGPVGTSSIGTSRGNEAR